MATTVEGRTNGRGMLDAIDELGEEMERQMEAAVDEHLDAVVTRSRRRTDPLPGQGQLFPPAAPSWEELGEQLDRVEQLRSAWQCAKEQVKVLKAEHDAAAETLRNMRVRQRYRHVDLHTGELAEGRP